ncbi:MAG: hypothetical protein ACFE75_00065 [Candidatus Hodarchaeota archaeon]
MPKLQKYEQKIRRYKEKLKKLITRIGISYIEEFELKDEVSSKLLFPCHLGILFFGEYDIDFFERIKFNLNQVYDSFFFGITNLGCYNFSIKQFSKGVKKEYKEMQKPFDKMEIHPTNKFYQILINKRKEENLGLIIAITDLPIYSSSNDNILFLFGETHLKHRCCVVSSLKLKEQFYNRPDDHPLFEQRVFKEIIHEVGHLIISPDHCLKNSCVMRFSNNVREIDKKSINFCDECKKKLYKVRDRFNF